VTPMSKRRVTAKTACVVATLWTASCATSSPTPNSNATPEGTVSGVIDKSRPAHEVYQNITLFTRDDVSAEFFDQLMSGISKDLGVGCLHCHAEGGLHIVDLPERKTASREMIPTMWGLVGAVNSRYFPDQGGPVRCWTCHRGEPTPERVKAEAEVSPLPALGGQGPQVDASAGQNLQVLRGLSRSELRQTMRTIASSLGVGCDACHIEGDRSSDKMPRKRIAREMLRMTLEIERNFFEPGRGPTCWSCHRGSTEVETER